MLIAGTSRAAEFINFTFDEGPRDLGALEEISGPGGVFRGTVSNILPGWEVEYQGKPVQYLGYSVPGHGGDIAPLTVQDYRWFPNVPYPGGRNALSLSLGDPPLRLDIALVLRQRGRIPTDAAQLRFEQGGLGEVRIDGLIIGTFDYRQGYPPSVDISPWAGKEVTLEFDFYRGQSLFFDNLGFVSVPEPSTWALLGAGLFALCWKCRRR